MCNAILDLANGHRGTLIARTIRTVAGGWSWAWVGTFNGVEVISVPKSLATNAQGSWAEGYVRHHLDTLARREA